jgi:hypothetical protein
VTQKNWATSKPAIVVGVQARTKGKLAQDANLDDLMPLLDRLDGEEAVDAEPEPVKEPKDKNGEDEDLDETDPALDAQFLAQSRAAGLANLKGHAAVGGMRASLYNPLEQAGVDALVDFMREFERRHG